MILNSSNYFSLEAGREYFSASQVKSFRKCEAAAMAEILGEYTRPMSTALTVGQYVDEAMTGDLESWLPNHPEILKRDGTLKADYEGAKLMVERAMRDPMFMSYMEGDHQTIITGDLFGVPFKAKFDVLNPKRIVDLKTVRDMSPVYVPGQGKVDFASAWDWPLQLAIYQALYEQKTGEKLPCYLAVITKETPADIAIVQVEQERMDAELALLRQQLPRFDAIKSGSIEAERCEKCAWCRDTKVLGFPVMLSEFEDFGGAAE